MKIDDCSRVRRFLKQWPIVIVILSIPGTLVLGCYLGDKFLGLLTTAVLVATLVSVTWYSHETRTLRLKQESDVEIAQHPWLTVEVLDSVLDPRTQRESETTIESEIVEFRIHNAGRTPAYNVVIDAGWNVDAEHGADQPSSNLVRSLGVVLPKAFGVFTIPISYELVARIRFALAVDYSTCHGGRGHFCCDCTLDGSGKATVRHSSLEFWLSNGRRYADNVSV